MLDGLGVFLSLPWWQGLAGIAQIIAAVLTVVAVREARRATHEIERQRRDTEAPSWEVGVPTTFSLMAEGDQFQTQVSFLNVGLGPARVLSAEIDRGGRPGPTVACAPASGGAMVEKDEQLMITFAWAANDPPNGRLMLQHVSRVGHLAFSQFHVRCWTDKTNDWGDCLVAPVLPNPPRRWQVRRALAQLNPLSTR